VISKKIIFQILLYLFIIKKLINIKYSTVNKKYFSIKEKFGLVFRKTFSFYFKRKTLSEIFKKFRNVILFADYIKFGPQIFLFLYKFCFEYLFFNFIS